MIERTWTWVAGEKHSVYGLAVTRIMLGFIISSQLLVNFADRHYTWGDGAAWTDPVQSAKDWPAFLDVMFVHAGGRVFDVVYFATIVVGLMMMTGFYSRASTALALLLWMSLYVANPFVGSGGDAVLRMVLLYMCFVDSGSHWSILRQMRASVLDDLAQLVIQRLDAVCRVDDPAQLGREGQERDEPFPRLVPRLHGVGIFLAPV